MLNKVQWYEKTVEYCFIRKFFPDEASITPLDGNAEVVGDTLSSVDDRWIIIEFKRDDKSIADEIRKFKNITAYYETKRMLEDKDSHHLVVYGKAVEHKLEIEMQTYFSQIKKTRSIDSIYNDGIDYTNLVKYLNIFTKNKKSGSGHLDFSIMGLNEKGEVSTHVSFSEFAQTICQDLKHILEQNQNEKIGYSRGMSM